MKIAYFDCSSGISGDMCLGALIDAGVPVGRLERELKKLPVKGYVIKAGRVRRAGFRAIKANVDINPKSEVQSPRKWKDVKRIISGSSLSADVKQTGLKIFRRLFEAEARVHGESADKVHLHELGAVDCIVDIMGTVICLDILGVERVFASAVNVGSGEVKTEHGILPVPAPAAIEILAHRERDAKCGIYSDGTNFELATPTGAAIIKELCSGFGRMPGMTVEKIGAGAGSKDFKGKPNILRIFIGRLSAGSHQPPDSTITVIETNIDDMNPQVYEYVMGKLFEAGALDVFLTQIIMKKGRPGVKLSALCNSKDRERLIELILKETTTIGLRFYEAGRTVMERESREISTTLGRVRIKTSKLGGETVRTTPEYEDCKRIAKKLNMPLVEVMRRISSS